MLVYLSGPMSGLPDENYPAFHEAAARLRHLGFDVINPAETAGGATHLPRPTYMDIDIGYVKAADAVVVMQGWRNSQGAKLEAIVCTAMGKPVFTYDPKAGVGTLVEITAWTLEAVEHEVSVNLDALKPEHTEEQPELGDVPEDTKIIPMFSPFYPPEVN